MKKAKFSSLFLRLAMGLLPLTALSADTTWKGGGGAFNDETKWDNGLPTADSVVTIQGVPEGAVVTNDIPNFSCKQLKCLNEVPLTLVGEKISISAGGHPLYCTCAVSIYAPIDLTYPWDNVKPYFGQTADFYAPVQTFAAKEFIVAGENERCKPRFHSTLSAPNQFLHSEGLSMYLELHQSTTLARLSTGYNWAGGGVVVYSSGNSWTNSLVGFYGNGIKACCENALPAESVLDFGGGIPGGQAGSDTAGAYTLQYDQTVDRIAGAANQVSGQELNVFHINNDLAATKTITLTLKGTADSETYAEVGPGIRIVWDPADAFIQTFRDRAHRLNQEIVVKGGVVCSAGKNTFPHVPSLKLSGGSFKVDSTGVCLPALTSIEIMDGGRFQVTENATESPFSASGIQATLRSGGKFELAEGVGLAVDTLVVDGVCPGPGTYTGVGYSRADVMEASWIIGAGTVSVANANVTSWRAAASGNWNDAANWTAGVPDGSKEILVTAIGEPYVVTVGEDAVLPSGLHLVVGSDGAGSQATVCFSGNVSLPAARIEVMSGGRIEVPTGCALTYSGVAADVGKSPIKIFRGGVFAVTGGTVTFSDFSGFVQVGDGADSTGSFLVSAGQVDMSPHAEGDGFKLCAGGELSMTGGDFAFPVLVKTVDGIKQYYLPILGAGGNLSVTGGTFGPKIGSENVVMKFNGGNIRFSGSGKFRQNGINNGLVFPAYVANSFGGPTNTYEISGSFDVLNEARTLLSVGGEDGAATLNWSADSVPDKSPHESNRLGAGCRVRVGWGGWEHGVHTLNVTGGCLGAGAIGLSVGDKEYSDYASMGNVRGIVNISGGGSVVVEGTGASGTGFTAALPQGVIIGNGFNTKVTEARRNYLGEVNVLADGSLTGWYGDFVVGGGHGDGTLNVDGGEVSINRTASQFKNNWQRVFGIGVLGGIGKCRVANGGSLKSRVTAWIGGVDAEKFVQPLLNSVNIDQIKDGTRGILTVEDGVVELERNLVLGALGYGVLTCKGSAGTCSIAGDLVCSNAVEIASSGSEINVIADESGVTPIEVAGALVVGPASRLSVDMSDYTGDDRRIKILGWGLRYGDFAQVSVAGIDARKHRLSWRPNGLYLTKVTGLAVIVR